MTGPHPFIEHAQGRGPEGPWQSLEQSGPAGWIVVAAQFCSPAGLVRWDVWAELRGNRVPAGPNVHDEPEAEMARLQAVLR